MLRCRACEARFSARKGNSLFGSHLPPEKAISALHHITGGNGVRKTGRLDGVNRETVARFGRKAGAHAAALHDELVTVSPRARQAQLDEKWAFVAEKQANFDPTDDRKGDPWDHVALNPDHRLVVSVVPGKRTVENTLALVRDFGRRTSGRLMNLITTDEYAPIVGRSSRRTGRRSRRPAPQTEAGFARRTRCRRPADLSDGPQDPGQGVGGEGGAADHPWHSRGGGRGPGQFGLEPGDQLDVRRAAQRDGPQPHARKTRKSYCISKDWTVHRAITYFTMYSYSFCWPIRTLRVEANDGNWRRQTSGEGGGPGRSRLVDLGSVEATRRPTEVGRERIARIRKIYY